jgi:membrane protein implicated in regulation of membrane protease activity
MGRPRTIRPRRSRRHDRQVQLAQDEALIGAIGKLIVGTRGAAGPGEVLVRVRGGLEAFIAWSPEPLPKGTTVLVIESRGHRAVDVSEWTDPVADFDERYSE